MESSQDWPFDQAPNVAVITDTHVLESGEPILRATHYLDDHSWAFLSGLADDNADGRVISMKEALDLDATLVSIADLQPGWTAWRESVRAAWRRTKNDSA